MNPSQLGIPSPMVIRRFISKPTIKRSPILPRSNPANPSRPTSIKGNDLKSVKRNELNSAKPNQLGPQQKKLQIRRTSPPNSSHLRHHHLFARHRHYSNSARPNPDPTPNLGSPTQSLSFSQRLKALSKEYGWTAVGVYFALSALDFPVCFLAVQVLGPERVGRWEHAVVDAIKSVLAIAFPNLGNSSKVEDAIVEDEVDKQVENGETKGTASIWTQLALAYAVHKSLIFFRVPLTAAVLPSVVKTLRKWGYNVGRKKVTKAV